MSVFTAAAIAGIAVIVAAAVIAMACLVTRILPPIMRGPRVPPLPPLPPLPRWESITRTVEVQVKAKAEGKDVVLTVADKDGLALDRFTLNEAVIEKAGWVRKP
jgi:hypothetical protein